MPDETDLPGQGEFLIPNGLWLLAPREAGGHFDYFVASVVKVRNADGIFVATFTDEDLARRYQERSGYGQRYQPFHLATGPVLAAFLEALLALGQTYVAVDVEENAYQRTAIQQLLSGMGR